MTPPLTDTELLAYIERTTGLKVLILTMLPLGMPLVDRYGKMLWRVRSIAYEFYAHEQRVREELTRQLFREAAHIAENAGSLAKMPGMTDEARCRELCAMYLKGLAVYFRGFGGLDYASTAPQLSTADAKAAPPPEGAGQGEAAEAVGLLRDVKKDLEDRAEDGVVELSSNVWQRLCDYLTKQEGKP